MPADIVADGQRLVGGEGREAGEMTDVFGLSSFCEHTRTPIGAYEPMATSRYRQVSRQWGLRSWPTWLP